MFLPSKTLLSDFCSVKTMTTSLLVFCVNAYLKWTLMTNCWRTRSQLHHLREAESVPNPFRTAIINPNSTRKTTSQKQPLSNIRKALGCFCDGLVLQFAALRVMCMCCTYRSDDTCGLPGTSPHATWHKQTKLSYDSLFDFSNSALQQILNVCYVREKNHKHIFHNTKDICTWVLRFRV